MVAFLYLDNFSAFPVGLEEPLTKSESQKIRRRENPVRGRVGSDRDGEGPSVRVATARRAVSYVLLLMASSLVSPVYLLL